MLQRVAVCSSVLQCDGSILHCVAMCCSALQNFALCCSVCMCVCVYVCVGVCVCMRVRVRVCVHACMSASEECHILLSSLSLSDECCLRSLSACDTVYTKNVHVSCILNRR